jgi:hypothetical protein
VVVRARVAIAAVALALSACGAPGVSEARDAHELAEGADLTVVTFFSSECPCQRFHDARLVALARAYAPRGVRFVAIDAESDATAARDEAEARARGYPFPVLADPNGAWADRFEVVFATETLVLDREGRVRYRGGIDSDRTHAADAPHLWLHDALEALLDGHEPQVRASKALGCALRRR